MFLKIDSIGFEFEELDLNNTKFAISKTVESKPGEEYTFGSNKNFFQIKRINSTYLYKYEIPLIVSSFKTIDLLKKFSEQRENLILNFDIETNSLYDIFYEFECVMSEKYGSTSYCLLDSVKIKDTQVKNGEIYYSLDLVLIECY